MQCPECSYISFKIKKTCGVCGFKFDQNKKNSPLLEKESFSIFPGFLVKKERNKKGNSYKNVGVMEVQELESFIDSETGNFNLDLPDIKDDEIQEAQVSSHSDKKVSKYESEGFNRVPYNDSGETKVEGLGFEPLPTTEEEKKEDLQINEKEPVVLEETQQLDETISLEPVLETSQTKEEPEIPALDLGDNEIDLDPGLKVPSNESHLKKRTEAFYEPELKLEIDHSKGPLITQNNEIPEIEIEDLGLELDSSDESEKDKN